MVDKKETKEKKKKRKKNKGRLRQTWLEHKKIKKNNLYNAWTILTHDACSNALRIAQLNFKNTELA